MNCTIIITASFIPSHPSIKIIKETIESLKYLKLKKDTEIILAHDFNDNPDYLMYLKNLKEYINQCNLNIKIVKRKTHGHLTGNIRNAIRYVKTKYILIMQHDFPFIEKLNLYKVIKDQEENPKLKFVRFNKRNNIRVGYDSGNSNLFGLQLKQTNYTYTRTPGWSDNNHLCLTKYYKDIILKECKNGKTMEKYYRGKIGKNTKLHKKYGTYIFGPINHKPMIKHIDGRKTV